MQLGLPAAWNVTSGLPAYQMAQSYNDANQPTTTTLTAVGASYSFTQVYDSSNGVLQGLSNTTSSTANLASLSYNEYAQLGYSTVQPPPRRASPARRSTTTPICVRSASPPPGCPAAATADRFSVIVAPTTWRAT